MKEITIFHSPDADDAFMFYGLTSGNASVPGYKFHSELMDIESLNQLALQGKLEVSAASVHAYPHLKGKYAILDCGASFGGIDYGPRLVAPERFDIQDGKIRRFAIPGPMTSATLSLRLYLRNHNVEAELIPMHFESVEEAIHKGEVEAGLLIHEGQLTHTRTGLLTLLDLGKWWWDTHHGLPLPLGVNIARKDLGEDAMRASREVLHKSVSFSLEHRKEALDYALQFGRGLKRDDADEFVGMYVNDRTLSLGEEGRRSILLFLSQGYEYGFVPDPGEIQYI